MLATTRQRILHINNNNLDVRIGDYKLVQSDCIDYLGVKIDETRSWNKQTDNICKQLVFIICRFSRLKHILPSHMIMLIYSSIIQPKFDDAITIWGYRCDNNLHKHRAYMSTLRHSYGVSVILASLKTSVSETKISVILRSPRNKKNCSYFWQSLVKTQHLRQMFLARTRD